MATETDIFDLIVQGEIPSYKVYEDEDVLAFLDLSQATPGHTLLIPKQHVADIYGYDEDLAARVLTKIPVVSRAIRDSDPAIIGLNVLMNNGAPAGQSVFHSHVHLIPRYENDGLNLPADVEPHETTSEIYAARAANIAKQFN
ncbi:HIT family protein [Weissella tructae]|uniref:Diadenosine tetraphosphate (Ap4A) hydrolase n=2 Tax=Weissella TaxID=46255 RepID=A0A075U013_9LACO|nr:MULTISPECIES: HIT family protein [Weissella]AIG65533.1 Diadenosine tetraphosphate (Ap4A) hydrolase [Weissella tructae]AIM62847.1 Diadenosine tetraphosphate (Ap4A) hydrolase [Weissella ceti]AIM64182.1 Diadenosine tetraphosphate (Ap4A) hydrolase [Weissella ceti]ELA07007.1 diadenosine tetraphosphate (Ap4A) hydrolase [Weissella ceti NC36]QVV91905.1 HIT family protein [Weissella tructae]